MDDYPKEMNADLMDILGRVNFACRPFAEALRVDGVEIPPKSEAEQAHCIHWMIGIYLEHGDNWREQVGNELERIAGSTVSEKGWKNDFRRTAARSISNLARLRILFCATHGLDDEI